MVNVKICGITNIEDAIYAAKFGADALGFVFYKKSPRYIKPENALKIVQLLPASVKKAGVFVNTGESVIRKVASALKLDLLQFHGDESVNFCRRFKGFKVIKALRLKGRVRPAQIVRYGAWAYLFDTFAKNRFGGTGCCFDWHWLDALRKKNINIFLSGGLNAQNVKKALRVFPAAWVDASSCLEKYPGRKDPVKVRKFINNAKCA